MNPVQRIHIRSALDACAFLRVEYKAAAMEHGRLMSMVGQGPVTVAALLVARSYWKDLRDRQRRLAMYRTLRGAA